MSNLPEYPNDDYMRSATDSLSYVCWFKVLKSVKQSTWRLLDKNNPIDMELHIKYTKNLTDEILPYLRFEARPPHRGTRTPMEVAKYVVQTYWDRVSTESMQSFKQEIGMKVVVVA